MRVPLSSRLAAADEFVEHIDGVLAGWRTVRDALPAKEPHPPTQKEDDADTQARP